MLRQWKSNLRNTGKVLLLLIFVSAGVNISICQTKTKNRLALTSVNVIDGNGGQPQKDMTVVIESGRITDIFRTGKKNLPADTTVTDLKGMYVLPGLIDAHVHLTGAYRNQEESDALLKFALLGGVTAVRDMGGDAIELARLADGAKDSAILSPRIYFSALMAGSDWFKDPRAKASAHGLTPGEIAWLKAITTETDIKQAVTEAKATGATGIKIYANLPADLVAKVTAEAHRQGLKVWSHATIFPSRPSDAVTSGVDAISHGALLVYEAVDVVPVAYNSNQSNIFSLYEKISPDNAIIANLLQKMRGKKTILDSTLYVMNQLAQRTGQTKATDPRVKWTFEITKLAHKNGVPIVAGTDGMGRPGRDEMPNIHNEMEMLVKMCGLTPTEAITAATRTGAQVLGIEKSYGTVSEGKIADLLILRENPLEDIRRTRNIYAVVKGGQLYPRN